MDNKCVKCGYCCNKSPCFYGQWDGAKCVFLTKNNLCSRYEEIIEKEKNVKYPMFGGGCPSTLFNTVRENKIKEMIDENNR